MNKFKLTTLTAALLFSSIVSAEYTIRVPLEVSQGGSLPNGSIVFISESSVEVNPVNPIIDYFSEPLNAILDTTTYPLAGFGIFSNYTSITTNTDSIYSAKHKSLTKKIRSATTTSPTQTHLSINLDCNDCLNDIPTNMSLTVNGNTFVGDMCAKSYIPYNELQTESDYSVLSCRFILPTGFMVQNDNFSLSFN